MTPDSASEALRALRRPNTESGGVWCEHCRAHVATNHYKDGRHRVGPEFGYTGADIALRCALPELIAVVEAVEKIAVVEPLTVQARNMAELARYALDALHRALTEADHA
jgi:hypothetical protein